MSTKPQRILDRYLRRATTIRVEIDLAATLKARQDHPGHTEMVVGLFDSSFPLYRIFDGEEMARIISTGKITGGTYSVKAERAHGASWGSNINHVIEWGNKLRGARLGEDLFLAKLDALDMRFAHLDPGILVDPSGPAKQPATMDSSKLNLSLGASVMDVSVREVDLYVVHPNHKIEEITLAEAKEYVGKRPVRDVELREMHPQLFQGTILGLDVRVWQDKGQWLVLTNDDRRIVTNAKTKDDAIELAQMAIKMNPSRPIPMDGVLLEHKRQYNKHFEVAEDPNKVRGTYALKPRDKLKVLKGSPKLKVPMNATLIVADIWQRKGEREVLVKMMLGSNPVTLYATHPNRLGDEQVTLMNSAGDKIFVRKL